MYLSSPLNSVIGTPFFGQLKRASQIVVAEDCVPFKLDVSDTDFRALVDLKTEIDGRCCDPLGLDLDSPQRSAVQIEQKLQSLTRFRDL